MTSGVGDHDVLSVCVCACALLLFTAVSSSLSQGDNSTTHNAQGKKILIHISMIGDGIDEQSVDRRLRSVYLETSVYTHRLHQ